MSERFSIEALAPEHDRAAFACGSDPPDRYVRQQASQDMRRRISVCYVAVDAALVVVGYYTLSAGSVALTELAPALTKALPRYPLVPVARIGRLAVSTSFQKRQLGAALLWDARQRAAQSRMGVFALVVDAKDERAAAFYRHHGFANFSADPLAFALPIASGQRKNG